MNKDEYYLGIAYAVAKKSTCLKKYYGAVIVREGEVIATGYNGPPRGEEHCKTCSKASESAQLLDNTSTKQFIDKQLLRAQNSNKDFKEYLSCRSVHAEMNAIISAARRDMIGSTLYLAGWEPGGLPLDDPKPCKICERLIKNAGIAFVITEKGVIYENKNY